MSCHLSCSKWLYLRNVRARWYVFVHTLTCVRERERECELRSAQCCCLEGTTFLKYTCTHTQHARNEFLLIRITANTILRLDKMFSLPDPLHFAISLCHLYSSIAKCWGVTMLRAVHTTFLFATPLDSPHAWAHVQMCLVLCSMFILCVLNGICQHVNVFGCNVYVRTAEYWT